MFDTIIQDQILKEYYNNVSMTDIAAKYNVSKPTVYNWIKSKNLELKNMQPVKYNRNYSFFNIPNIINSYWAGFIAADGHLHKNGRDVQIKLSIEDYDHLEKFKEIVEYTGTIKTGIRTYKSGGFLGNDFCRLTIHAVPQWHNDLWDNYNIPCGDKTSNLTPPLNLSNEHKFSFITGLIDGDGYVSVRKNKNRYTIGVIGTEAMVNYVKLFFDTNYPASNEYHISNIKCKNTYWHYALSGKRIIKFMDEVRETDLPVLKRKWYK